mmetsp:Transcript_22361/g.56919  ORF Transcript_22361/g.56919 Transcript_22361/m.56919 type:complete len:256 (-) Transcript_22361:255-1022(-)
MVTSTEASDLGTMSGGSACMMASGFLALFRRSLTLAASSVISAVVCSSGRGKRVSTCARSTPGHTTLRVTILAAVPLVSMATSAHCAADMPSRVGLNPGSSASRAAKPAINCSSVYLGAEASSCVLVIMGRTPLRVLPALFWRVMPSRISRTNSCRWRAAQSIFWGGGTLGGAPLVDAAAALLVDAGVAGAGDAPDDVSGDCGGAACWAGWAAVAGEGAGAELDAAGAAAASLPAWASTCCRCMGAPYTPCQPGF